MAWSYEIHDSNDAFVAKGEGFAIEQAAFAAGTVEAERLNRTGNLPASGSCTVHTTEDSSTPWQ